MRQIFTFMWYVKRVLMHFVHTKHWWHHWVLLIWIAPLRLRLDLKITQTQRIHHRSSLFICCSYFFKHLPYSFWIDFFSFTEITDTIIFLSTQECAETVVYYSKFKYKIPLSFHYIFTYFPSPFYLPLYFSVLQNNSLKAKTLHNPFLRFISYRSPFLSLHWVKYCQGSKFPQ